MANNYISAKAGGAWRNGKPYVKVGGSWVEVKEAHVKVSGTWQKSFQNTIEFTSTGNRTSVNIAADFGNPTEAGTFIWTNNGDIGSGSAGTFAVTTGTFPVGSTLTIINNGYIRGRGGAGGSWASPKNGSPGQNALNLAVDVSIENASGYIWGGGGGGGATDHYVSPKVREQHGGGGGAGSNAGSGGTAAHGNGSAGTLTTGGAGSISQAGAGGACGVAGAAGTGSEGNGAGGAAGKAVAKNGYSATFLSGNDSARVKGAVS